MALSTSKQTTLDVPGEPGQTVTIRKLSARAADAAQMAQIEKLVALKDIAASVVGDQQIDPEQARAYAEANPYAQYEPATVLKHCVVAWTYSGQPTAEEIDDLEPETRDWLFGECMKFSVRSAAEGEASGPSSSTPSVSDELGPENSATS